MIYNNPKVKIGENVEVFYAGTTGVYKVAAVRLSSIIIEVPEVNGSIMGWLGSNNPFESRIYNLSINKRYWYIYHWKKVFTEIEL